MLNKAFDEYKERIEKYNKDNEAKMKLLSEKLASLQKKHSELKNTNVKLNNAEVKKYEHAIDVLSEAISNSRVNITTISNKTSQLKLDLHKLNQSKDFKQKGIDKHSELMNKLCKDCKKIFSDYYNIDTYLSEIQKIAESIEEINVKIGINDKEVDKINTTIKGYEDKLQKAKDKLKSLTEEYNKTNKEINSLESSMMIVESDLSKTKNEKNPYTELFENNKNEIEKHTKELDGISETYKYLKFAENIVSQDTLRKFIIADLIGLLNNKIRMYLTKFGAKYNVVFDADMEYEFITEGGSYEYDNFSAGERARLMIAACFAFRDFMYIRNNLSSNILILDEFIDGAIDSIAIDSILDILKDFSKLWKQNIFVISHRKEIDNTVFNNII